MGAKVDKVKAKFLREMQKIIESVRQLKDAATGQKLRRLHRVESELLTIKGQKRARTMRDKIQRTFHRKVKTGNAKK